MGTSATQTSLVQARNREQRQSPRRRVIQPTPIELLPGKEVWLHDLGEGGLSVSGSSPLELGTTTAPRFHLQEANSVIEASGVVAWNDNSGRLGIRFTRVESASTSALRSWLRTGAIAASGNPAMNDPATAELATRISCLGEVADLQSVIAREQFDCDAALDLIVRRMIELTRSTGAAIALRDGEDVVCRARAGNAPDVGVRLSPTSLSGECFQSGTIVMLEDSESDPRVNPELCRQLNFRSLLVLPVTSGTEIIGIAEVLSSNPRNFAGGDILVLSFLTDLIANVSQPSIEPDPSATPDIPSLEMFEELTLPSDLMEVDETPNGNAALAARPSVFESEPEPTEVARTTSPAAAMPLTVSREVTAAATPIIVPAATAAETPIVVPAATPERIVARRPEKVTGIQVQPEPRNPILRWLPLALTLVVLLATAALLIGYYMARTLETGKKIVIPANATATASQPTAPLVQPAPKDDPATKPASAQITALRNELNKLPTPQTKQSSASTSRPATATEDELTVVHGSTQRLANAEAVPEAPTVGALDSRGGGNLPASLLTANTPVPSLRANASGGVTEGKLLKKVMPRYPEMARTAGVSGDVILSAKIGIDGNLRDIKVVAGSPLLRDAAVDAAKQWRYSPYKLGGKAVETDTKITISFHR
jgi:TonB family protein